MSRPKKEINWDLVRKMMEAGCSAKEIYGALEIIDDTFYNRFKEHFGKSFSDYSDEAHSGGKGNIRLMQYKKAMEGSAKMLELLGREWNGQGKEQQLKSPFEDYNSIVHDNMLLKAELAELKEKMNAYQPQTRQEL